jgi:acetyl esterase/lipase
MVAISAEYRTAKPHGTTPAECVNDGKSAIRYVRAHAKSLGIDPQRIAAGGGSAGGQIAAATATLTSFDDPDDDPAVSARPDALVLYNPVFDNGPSGYGHDRVKAYWQSFSPLHNLTAKTPPAIVFLGTNDNLIPVATAENFRDTMRKLGVRSELFLYDGQSHGFFNAKNPEYHEKTLAETDRFLTSLGFLSPPTSNTQ